MHLPHVVFRGYFDIQSHKSSSTEHLSKTVYASIVLHIYQYLDIKIVSEHSEIMGKNNGILTQSPCLYSLLPILSNRYRPMGNGLLKIMCPRWQSRVHYF